MGEHHPHEHNHKNAHNHDHDHDHNHTGAHNHHPAPKDFGKAFVIGIILNSAFIVAETAYCLAANSLALLADAGHNASDVLGLFMAWGATLLAQRKPSGRYTYGLQSSSIIAALANAIILLVVTGGIGWEALQRMAHPQASTGTTVIAVAALGILVNGFTAWLFMSGSKGDLNVRGAFLHMAADALVSFGVVLSGAIMLATGWLWLDPIVGLIVAFVIVMGTWGLLKDSINLALHAAPKGIEISQVKAYLAQLPDVQEIHDLHIWAMSTTETALSAHLLMANGHPGDEFLSQIAHQLGHDHNIRHVTIQIEVGDADAPCALASTHMV